MVWLMAHTLVHVGAESLMLQRVHFRYSEMSLVFGLVCVCMYFLFIYLCISLFIYLLVYLCIYCSFFIYASFNILMYTHVSFLHI